MRGERGGIFATALLNDLRGAASRAFTNEAASAFAARDAAVSMRRLAHLVLSAALLGTAARSPNHDSLRSQLEPASSEVSGKLSCPGGAVPTLKSIYVRSADEGLSSWRIVLAELLVLAHMTGAALIEPCVHKSRLVACDVAQSKGYNRVLVSELFDVPALSAFATIVPPDDAPNRSNDAFASIRDTTHSQYPCSQAVCSGAYPLVTLRRI